jgi:hypothetical protein
MRTGTGGLSFLSAPGSFAQHLDQLVMDDLDDHLAGVTDLMTRPTALLLDRLDELARHFKRHVGLEQRHGAPRAWRYRRQPRTVRPGGLEVFRTFFLFPLGG